MKLTAMLAALGAILILTGCDSPAPGMLSIEPVTTEKDTVIDRALLGVWQEQGDDPTMAVIRPGDNGGYKIRVMVEPQMAFDAKMFRVGDAEFLDMSPSDGSDFSIPGHSVMRVWVDGSTLKWAFLDSDWLKQQIGSLASRKNANGQVHLLAPTADVRAFLAANAANDKAYGNIANWERAQ